MGVFGRLVWVNNYGKKQCRSLFWRVRAAMKRAVKINGSKRQFRFHYDPLSYALNFDDGGWKLGEGGNGFQFHKVVKIEDISEATVWVYFLWVDYS
ncbi:Vesicle-trafficking protein like [Actinidia chinensis var. chinensis]|uniref:Vesicle-trafficking protein like n=1 Tax=Actinidia chinensis var. chinensis TaxID=1590841 RepID=A0A2R6RAT4_ACTCC|nr:Vesicle-trafficking protein like [Actinidia chinensis var. chinensis]